MPVYKHTIKCKFCGQGNLAWKSLAKPGSGEKPKWILIDTAGLRHDCPKYASHLADEETKVDPKKITPEKVREKLKPKEIPESYGDW